MPSPSRAQPHGGRGLNPGFGRKTTPRGFEPLRAKLNGFRVHLLNRSDTVSLAIIDACGRIWHNHYTAVLPWCEIAQVFMFFIRELMRTCFLLSCLFVFFLREFSQTGKPYTVLFVGLWNYRTGTKILRQQFSVKPALCAVTNVVPFFPKTFPATGPR